MANRYGRPSWAALPRKGQLLVLCMIRITEPITVFCLNSYIFYQLRYLDPNSPDDEIIRQASSLRSVYMLAQCVSCFLWGLVADSPLGGRKLVLLIALGCSFLSNLSLCFISSYKQAIVIYAAQGFSNNNTAIVRTLVSEVVSRFQARAFVLLPICTSFASVLGPLIAGLTVEANPQTQTSNRSFLERHPYALPPLINSMLLLVPLFSTFFFLEEVSKPLREEYDPGIAISRRIMSFISRSSRHQLARYEAVPVDIDGDREMECFTRVENGGQGASSMRPKSILEEDEIVNKAECVLPTSWMFTKKMMLVLFAGFLQDIQVGVTSDAMNNLLSFPVASEEQERQTVLPFRFTGGAGFKPSSLAWTTCIFGMLGLPFQLWLYPRITQSLGVLRTWRYFMFAFPSIWFLYPYIAVLPSSLPPPSEKTGFFIWGFIVFLAIITGLFVGCVMPCQLILVAQSSPHPSALAKTQSIAFFVSTATRASSSAISGVLLAFGLDRNLAGLPFWLSALVGAIAIGINPLIEENGFEG
ncbi:major facilitator superfamily domain-containing protein [Bipolaris maydis]|nr:major facilitator superfamily domain-containing protein [Bipolaris maydis]